MKKDATVTKILVKGPCGFLIPCLTSPNHSLQVVSIPGVTPWLAEWVTETLFLRALMMDLDLLDSSQGASILVALELSQTGVSSQYQVEVTAAATILG